ncbi:hypothetical protein ACWCSH_41855 [Streptosporangium sp. NPDC001682]
MAEDDQSDSKVLEAVLCGLANRCDVLLGSYSTRLMRGPPSSAA